MPRGGFVVRTTPEEKAEVFALFDAELRNRDVVSRLNRSKAWVQQQRNKWRAARQPILTAGQLYDRTLTKASPAALAERERYQLAQDKRSLTQHFCGDPPPGFSALDRYKMSK